MAHKPPMRIVDRRVIWIGAHQDGRTTGMARPRNCSECRQWARWVCQTVRRRGEDPRDMIIEYPRCDVHAAQYACAYKAAIYFGGSRYEFKCRAIKRGRRARL